MSHSDVITQQVATSFNLTSHIPMTHRNSKGTQVKVDINNVPWDSTTAASAAPMKFVICKLERSVGGQMEYAIPPVTCSGSWRLYKSDFANPGIEFASPNAGQ